MKTQQVIEYETIVFSLFPDAFSADYFGLSAS